MNGESYVLITAARNEETYIPKILQSVVSQTVLPKIWVIVDDGSTDRTGELVMDFASRYDFIRLIRRSNSRARVFSNKVSAINEAYDDIRDTSFDFAGFPDADVSFDAVYFENLLSKFRANPRLGIAAGQVLENQSGDYVERYGSSEECVPGAVLFFRRHCYEDIGARFIPLRHGGEDAVANVMARQKGWEVRSYPDLRVLHHRPTGTAGTTVWRARLHQGMEEYFIGYDALFEAGKCVRRANEPPYILGSVLRFTGYLFSSLTRQKRIVPADFVRYLRQEQRRRIFEGVFGRQEEGRNRKGVT